MKDFFPASSLIVIFFGYDFSLPVSTKTTPVEAPSGTLSLISVFDQEI